jgi:putative ABC transport system permease protein
MTALPFAWRSLVRQPARSTLGVLGVAAVGALLFDMLLLSEGLVVSMRDLFERMGFDIRIIATDQLPAGSPDIRAASTIAAKIAALPTVQSALTIRTEDADFQTTSASAKDGSIVGIGEGAPPPWTVLRGRDLRGPQEVVLNQHAAQTLNAEPGAMVVVRATCAGGSEAPPSRQFRVVGIAELPFEAPEESAAGTTAASLSDACGTPQADLADFLAVTSTGDPDAAAADIARIGGDLRIFTNEQAIGQLQQGGFTYFRQISTVLSTITISFALLLITVLLTVSVNQRLGEVAALRALGFSRNRVVLDVLCESALIVGIGGLLSLPLGAVMAAWLDGILKRMPGIPAELHFFVFEPKALLVHGGLLIATAVIAALYPMRIVARLPIAATLRNEVVS